MKKHGFCRMLSVLLWLVLTVSLCSFGAQASLEDPFSYDVTIAKGEDDYRLHFPDIVLIPQELLPEKDQAAYPEGKLLVAYYQNKGHVPETRKIESMGWIEMVESKDSGKTWSEPVHVVTPQKLLEWGVATDALPLESRDPNFAILSDGTLLLTFFTRNDGFSDEIESYILMSHDGGVTWGEPMMIQHDYEGVCAKRGDITQFANGDILVPVYKDPEAYGILYSYDPETRMNEYDLTLFLRREEGLYERFLETHRERAWRVKEVEALLAEAGLKPEGAACAYGRETDRILFQARETGKRQD